MGRQVLAAPLHPALSWVHSSNLKTLAPKHLLPWGLPPGVPSAFQLVSVGQQPAGLGVQAAADPQPGPAVPGSWAAAPLAPSHTGLPVDASGETALQQELPTALWCLSVKPATGGAPAGSRDPPTWLPAPALLPAGTGLLAISSILSLASGRGRQPPGRGPSTGLDLPGSHRQDLGVGVSPESRGRGASRQWHHVQRVIVKAETCMQQAVGLCPRPPRHSGLAT